MIDGGAIKYISTKYDNAMKAIANNVVLIKTYSIVKRDALQGNRDYFVIFSNNLVIFSCDGVHDITYANVYAFMIHV